jgi:hypothetical protein
MNGMSSAYISIELQADKKGQYFNADFPLLLQDKVEQALFTDTVTEINKLWNKGNQLRTYVTITAAVVMLTVILIAVIGFPSGHESESEHGHEGASDSGGKYKLFGLLFLGIAAIAVIPIFNLQLLSWKMRKIEEYLKRENRFTYHALGVNWTFDRETCNLLIHVDSAENEG